MRKFKPIFYKNHIPKSMIATRKLQMIYNSLDNFKHWFCDFNCVKQPCTGDIKDPVSRYLCYKLQLYVLIKFCDYISSIITIIIV